MLSNVKSEGTGKLGAEILRSRGRCTKPRNISKVIILENWN